MAVEVIQQGNRKQHEGSHGVRVTEGHLYVMSSTYNDADIVAVYAPGKWDRAVVNGTADSP